MVKITKDNLPGLLKRIKRLTKSEVLVGVPEDKSTRKEDEGIPNAALMFINEHGSPAQNIPARPALGPGIKKATPKIANILKKAATLALDTNDEGKIEQQLNAAGLTAQSSIKNVIRAGISPELAAGTLAARRAKGRTGEKPLIDTGQLLNSITYVIRRTK